MKELFKKYNIEINDNQSDLLETYFNYLVEYNKNVNLTAITKKEDVYVKHFLDSLLIFQNQDLENKKILDLGAGAGFPSVPNAILNPNTQFYIIETLNKRCVFLNLLIEKLGLNNVTVMNKRGEDINENEIEFYDITCARAVAKANVLLEILAKYTKIDGLVILPKANLEKEELDNAKQAAWKLNLKYQKIDTYEFENNTRNNIIIKKEKKTPKKYPRNFGMIKNNPLK